MARHITFTHARANFAAICEEAGDSRKPIIIRRRGAEDIALVNAAELRGLVETAHLLQSPTNAQRLIAAITRSRRP